MTLRWPPEGSGMRRPTIAREVVATSQPLAAQAGLAMLRQGGNAVDAALAAGIALTVVEPASTGLGSDAFALVWDGRTVHALNGSGGAPRAWTPDVLKSWSGIAPRGWNSITVPGMVALWRDLSERFGRLPFAKLFEPAIEWAEAGFPVSPSVADRWQVQAAELAPQPGFADAYMPGGKVPAIGQIFRLPALARSLQDIAETKGRTFYEGRLAEAMLGHSRAHGGLMAAEDLANHRTDWVTPLQADVLGHTLYEMPPNSQGLVVPMTLGILAHCDVDIADLGGAASIHLQIEAFKLAAADVARYVADPDAMPVHAEALLSPDYLKTRAKLIGDRAQTYQAGLPVDGGTVVVTAGDRDGMMVSLLQSNFVGFGSGVVVPDTGISLHNRAGSFTFKEGHPNAPAPGKRPLHTLLPAMVFKDGAPLISLGVTGGNMQPQGHVQLLLRVLAANSEPQSAIEAARYRYMADMAINLEDRVDDAVKTQLAARGHVIKPMPPGYMDFGSAQIVYRLGESWLAATDNRKDGAAIGW
ncbi:gamma-glutamyltransferase family protein [Pseudolabrys taiwanensis]|uniref:Gamma-glutamyltransferase family protein n=2 Tax=Pseudolabrys taiwanensis TaxID=331696 RepID=A0A345ZW25_9HYPH|nr:gamma-glutamyltransferase family protein [Pseudolabrys taiwanensis]